MKLKFNLYINKQSNYLLILWSIKQLIEQYIKQLNNWKNNQIFFFTQLPVLNPTRQPILGPRAMNHPLLSSIEPYPLAQNQTIFFYPVSNHTFRPSIKSYPSTKHWTICTFDPKLIQASNHPLWTSIKPFPSI